MVILSSAVPLGSCHTYNRVIGSKPVQWYPCEGIYIYRYRAMLMYVYVCALMIFLFVFCSVFVIILGVCPNGEEMPSRRPSEKKKERKRMQQVQLIKKFPCHWWADSIPAPAAVHWTTLTASIFKQRVVVMCPSTGMPAPLVGTVSRSQHLSQIREYITV